MHNVITANCKKIRPEYHLYLSKLYLKHYWFHFFPDTVYLTIHTYTHTHTHTQPFYGPPGFCPGLPGWASIRKVKPGT